MKRVIAPCRTKFLAVVAVAATVGLQPLVMPPASAATCGFLQACPPPESQLTRKPADNQERTTTSTVAAFEFTTTDGRDKTTFACKLDGPAGEGAWEDCSTAGSDPSTGSKLYTDLRTLGSYTFSVRASDNRGFLGASRTESTPETWQWTVVEPDPEDPPPDVDAPETTITRGPDRWHLFPFAEIRYKGGNGTVAYQCTFQGKPQDCEYGAAQLFGMTKGDYRFTAAAIDDSGNVDGSPAATEWTIPLNNTALNYSKEWKDKHARGYFRDSYAKATKKGAYAQQGRPKGFRSAALIATKCPDCGTVKVLLDGKRIKKIDLSASKERHRRVIELGTWKKKQDGRLRFVVTSKGKDVILEGFGFSTRR